MISRRELLVGTAALAACRTENAERAAPVATSRSFTDDEIKRAWADYRAGVLTNES